MCLLPFIHILSWYHVLCISHVLPYLGSGSVFKEVERVNLVIGSSMHVRGRGSLSKMPHRGFLDLGPLQYHRFYYVPRV